MRTLWFYCFVLGIGFLSSLQAQETDKVYSGPQASEPLPSFALHRLNGSDAGREIASHTLSKTNHVFSFSSMMLIAKALASRARSAPTRIYRDQIANLRNLPSKRYQRR